MIRKFLYLVLNLVAFSSTLISQSLTSTPPSEVMALQDLYRAFNYSEALRGWNGSDPCEESWTGVACSGSSVVRLNIQGLKLTGSLCMLYNLRNLKQLDVSSNKIVGEITFGLPPNLTHMNLSHNFLIGPIGDMMLSGLDNPKEMFLHNNRFTGSVTYLAELPLNCRNIQDNLFSGLFPHHFQYIKSLLIGGNKLHAADNSPPWTAPLETLSVEQNISNPPTTNANAIKKKNYVPPKVSEHKHKKKQSGPGGIAFMVGGTLLATGVALLVAIHFNKHRAQSRNLNLSESNDISLHSHPTSSRIGEGVSPREVLLKRRENLSELGVYGPFDYEDEEEEEEEEEEESGVGDQDEENIPDFVEENFDFHDIPRNVSNYAHSTLASDGSLNEDYAGVLWDLSYLEPLSLRSSSPEPEAAHSPEHVESMKSSSPEPVEERWVPGLPLVLSNRFQVLAEIKREEEEALGVY